MIITKSFKLDFGHCCPKTVLILGTMALALDLSRVE